MATLISAIRDRARTKLLETTASFWTDAELLDDAVDGIKDLWRAILDLHQEHFLTIDTTNVSLAANTTTLTGVPADVFRVHTLEPRDLTDSAAVRDIVFKAKDYNHPDFVAARGLSAQDPNGLTIFFTVITAGAPVGAPSIVVAPKLNAALNLTLAYIPTLAALTAASNNPIPGESDHAVFAWTMAHALGKERADRQPDPVWMEVYATDKRNLLIALTPRQEQDPDYVEGMFEEYY